MIESEWMASGQCRNYPPETFFPSSGAGVAVARRICRSCDSQQICLEYALVNHIDHGIWGATSERQRRKLRRRLAKGEQLVELINNG